MKTDPKSFVEAALSGLSSRPIHASQGRDPKTGEAVIIPGADPASIGQRAVELGFAAAAAYDKALESIEDEATRPAKKAARG